MHGYLINARITLIHYIQVVMAIRLLSTHACTVLQNALVSILFLLAFIAGIVPLGFYANMLLDDCDDTCFDCGSGDNGKCDETASDYQFNVSVTLFICMVRYRKLELDVATERIFNFMV